MRFLEWADLTGSIEKDVQGCIYKYVKQEDIMDIQKSHQAGVRINTCINLWPYFNPWNVLKNYYQDTSSVHVLDNEVAHLETKPQKDANYWHYLVEINQYAECLGHRCGERKGAKKE